MKTKITQLDEKYKMTFNDIKTMKSAIYKVYFFSLFIALFFVSEVILSQTPGLILKNGAESISGRQH
jgi:hypothetical protein